MISKTILEKLYVKQGKSLQETASFLNCSVHKVSYWLGKYVIPTRSISEAVYKKYHPQGDPFIFRKPKTIEEGVLFGMGLGLYWGEGTKADKGSVRLGNTDPDLIKKFIEFLEMSFAVRKKDMHFGLQIFTDMSSQKAMDFWKKRLKINSSQFYKITITKSRSLGTYRKKTQHGVLTVYYHNKKMRDILVGLLPL